MIAHFGEQLLLTQATVAELAPQRAMPDLLQAMLILITFFPLVIPAMAMPPTVDLQLFALEVDLPIQLLPSPLFAPSPSSSPPVSSVAVLTVLIPSATAAIMVAVVVAVAVAEA